MLSEIEFNQLAEKLKSVTQNRRGDKVVSAYLSMDYEQYCKVVERNEGKEPSDLIIVEYEKPIYFRYTGPTTILKYYTDGSYYYDAPHRLDLIID